MQNYQMINVGDKSPTKRVCLATGKLLASPEIIQRIKNGDLPKGNVLPLAEAAGITAVKKTSDILPLCHPLPIDAAYVSFEFGEKHVQVFCEVSTVAKTGVEMEALNGVNAALLCIYDLTKGIEPVLELSDVHLVRKEGGKSGLWTHPKEKSIPSTQSDAKKSYWSGISFSVITLSDRCSQGLAEDTSGPAIIEYGKNLAAQFIQHELIPDQANKLKETLQSLNRERKTNLVICTGGTGVGPRDLTPETVMDLGGKIIPGIGEAMRKYGANFTPYAWLSRSEGFLLDQMLVICLPGSKKAVTESLDAIAMMIPHAMNMIRGDSH